MGSDAWLLRIGGIFGDGLPAGRFGDLVVREDFRQIPDGSPPSSAGVRLVRSRKAEPQTIDQLDSGANRMQASMEIPHPVEPFDG